MVRYNIVWQWDGVIYSRTCKSRTLTAIILQTLSINRFYNFFFVLCFVFVILWLSHVSAVPNVASVSGLSILDFPSVFSNIYFNKGLLLIPGKHLHDDIISVRGEIGARETGLTPLLFIAVPVRSHDVERWCMYVLMVSCFHFFMIVLLDIWTITTNSAVFIHVFDFHFICMFILCLSIH